MSKYPQVQRTLVLFVGLVAALCLALTDAAQVSADSQNENTPPVGNENSSMGQQDGARRAGRRNRRRARRRARRARRQAAANMATDTNANMATETPATDAETSAPMTDTQNTSGGMADDLSGTYTGTVNMPEHNASGPATLTVTGNSYTLEGAGMTHSGRFTAITTRGYTGVSMELGPTDAGQMPTYVSVRARRLGNNGLSLMSVPGERHRFSFTTGGSGGTRRRPRARRARRRAAAPTHDASHNMNQ